MSAQFSLTVLCYSHTFISSLRHPILADEEVPANYSFPCSYHFPVSVFTFFLFTLLCYTRIDNYMHLNCQTYSFSSCLVLLTSLVLILLILFLFISSSCFINSIAFTTFLPTSALLQSHSTFRQPNNLIYSSSSFYSFPLIYILIQTRPHFSSSLLP